MFSTFPLPLTAPSPHLLLLSVPEENHRGQNRATTNKRRNSSDNCCQRWNSVPERQLSTSLSSLSTSVFTIAAFSLVLLASLSSLVLVDGFSIASAGGGFSGKDTMFRLLSRRSISVGGKSFVPRHLHDRSTSSFSPLLTLSTSSLSSFSNTDGSTTETGIFDGPNKNSSSATKTTVPCIPTNQDLVFQRLAINAAKKAARTRSLQQDRERNLYLKQRLVHTESISKHNNSNNNNKTNDDDEGQHFIPPLYAIKVSTDEILRSELKLNGRERRGRVFIERQTNGCQTLRGLKFELHSFFRCLRRGSYVLGGCLPVVGEDGSIPSPPDMESSSWPIETDEDVIKTFEAADSFYSSFHGSRNDDDDDDKKREILKRPTILIHVRKDPNAPAPPPPPSYLENMPDPAQSPSMTMLSFYAFPPEGVDDPEDFAFMLRKVWKPFGALGRVYVAREGINAQMSVPTNVIENFMECCKSIPELGIHMENGINIDPKPLTLEEFETAGAPVNGKPAPPFKNLHVRVRNQVVADGLNRPLDWQKAGYDMPPLEWHEKLKEARAKREQPAGGDGVTAGKKDIPLILDCRNTYETAVGRFEGAEPLNTDSFRDSWDVLKARLADVPKDAPIMTYCTGGIRCVKVGAYLTQEMGFTNVSRLAGGIIAYDRTLAEKAKAEEPMFKGTNYVFDGRVGRQITDDGLAECITCGERTSLITNCKNDNCHIRMVQCEKCRTSFLGTCSDACKQRVLNSMMSPHRGLKIGTSGEKTKDFRTLHDYSAGHSTPPPSLFREIELNTQSHLSTGSHMVSGPTQGRLLTQLASMTRNGRVLELGTFTGYATACFLEGVAEAGEAIGYEGTGDRNRGPFVLTFERDPRAFDLATSHLKIMSEYGVGEEGAEEACKLRGANGVVPEITDENVFFTYNGIAGCEIARVTDALAAVEEMAAGRGSIPTAPFDLVFVDADKTRLLDYIEACVSSDRMLKKGGMIVVDNVLWKGLVLEASRGRFSQSNDSSESDMDEAEMKKTRRARKLATIMHNFNSAIVKDKRVEVVVLPMRDGLSIIRKR